MPELPEVETVRRQLSEVLVGSAKQNPQVISAVEVLKDKSFQGNVEDVVGKEIVDVRRYGKVLVLDLRSKIQDSSDHESKNLLNQDNGVISSATQSSEKSGREQSNVSGTQRDSSRALQGARNDGTSIVIHLKMTGQLIYEGVDSQRLAGGHPTGDFVNELPSKHTRVVFKLKKLDSRFKNREGKKIKAKIQKITEKSGVGNSKVDSVSNGIVTSRATRNPHNDTVMPQRNDDVSTLYFNDQRMFGWVKVMPTDEVEELPFIKKLGKEIQEITAEEWAGILLRSGKAVKVRLMDQDQIAGVGNIYANDGCWEAKIDPRRPAKSLSADEMVALQLGVAKVLEEGIKYGGATAMDGKYIDLQGLGGTYQEHFRTYQREGEHCLRDGCDGVIQKAMVGGRGTFWCGECQEGRS